MKTTDTAVVVDAHVLKHRWSPTASLEENLRVLFTAAQRGDNLIFSTSDDQKFRSAVGAALLCVLSSEDRAWIEQQLLSLRQLSAFLEAARAGLDVTFPITMPLENPRSYALMQLWHDVRGKPVA